MFGTYHLMMNQDDDKLRALLKQWHDIGPPGDFETNVWRQIRLADDTHPARIGLIETMGQLLWQPAWSVAVALLVATLVGVWGGVASTPHRTGTSQAELQFLGSGTLAGSYLQSAVKESH